MSDEKALDAYFLRQAGFADPNKFKLNATILGVGAVGSVAAIAMAKMGIPKMSLIDYDMFEYHNVANQMCLETEHIGSLKAPAIANLVHSMSPIKEVTSYAGKLEGDQVFLTEDHGKASIPARTLMKGIVVNVPDDMEARKDCWKVCKYNPNVKLVIDCRVAAQYIVIHTAGTLKPDEISRYEQSLHSNEEASEAPCGERGIIYTSLIAGSMISNFAKKFMLGEPIPQEFRMDVHSGATTQIFNGVECTTPEEIAVATV